MVRELVGPDVPVYLWWTRVAEFGGISLAAEGVASMDGHGTVRIPRQPRGPADAGLDAVSRPRDRWQAALPGNEEMVEPGSDLHEVLDPAPGRSRAGELV